ncbi:MAG: hypothetical protein NTX33_03795 [Propionibacteriales bacterium]|nr:hypothetical protein [Propionibacteriales bacterium]
MASPDLPDPGEDGVTIDAVGSALPSSDGGLGGLVADRRIELPVNLPAARRRRTRGAGWFVVGFLMSAGLGVAIWVLVALVV